MRAVPRGRAGTAALLGAIWASLAVPAAAQSTPVDLLHAVGTDVAVSSAYRSQASQAGRLVDGDLETAWNSRTGDLVGAWIEIRVPVDAQVTSIALTPGFTHQTEARDLFTSNHRVTRVRVLHDGAEVGVFPVEVAAPALVTLPVHGAGGVYRIEVMEVQAGSRPDWRETCISELRVMGSAPGMTPGARMPRTAVGALPAPVATAPLDPAALERAQRRDVGWLVTAWADFQRTLDDVDQNTGEPIPDASTQRDLDRQLDAILTRIAALAAPVDAARSDALRLAATQSIDWADSERRHDAIASAVDRLAAALDAVAAAIATDEARCRSARSLAAVRLRRIASAAHLGAYFDEIAYSEDEMTETPHTREADRRGAQLGRDDEALDAAAREWSTNGRGVATRLSRHAAPVDPAAAREWPALGALLETARATCGW